MKKEKPYYLGAKRSMRYVKVSNKKWNGKAATVLSLAVLGMGLGGNSVFATRLVHATTTTASTTAMTSASQETSSVQVTTSSSASSTVSMSSSSTISTSSSSTISTSSSSTISVSSSSSSSSSSTPSGQITLSFDSMGGSAVASMTGVPGFYIGALPSPAWAGHFFLGWFTDKSYTNHYTSHYAPNSSTTLYALWATGLQSLTAPVSSSTTVGTAFDLMSGVSATNTAGGDFSLNPLPVIPNVGEISGWTLEVYVTDSEGRHVTLGFRYSDGKGDTLNPIFTPTYADTYTIHYFVFGEGFVSGEQKAVQTLVVSDKASSSGAPSHASSHASSSSSSKSGASSAAPSVVPSAVSSASSAVSMASSAASSNAKSMMSAAKSSSNELPKTGEQSPLSLEISGGLGVLGALYLALRRKN